MKRKADTLQFKLVLFIADIIVLLLAYYIASRLTLADKINYSSWDISIISNYFTNFFLLVISYFLAITILKIHLLDRGMRMTYVILRAIGQSVMCILIFSFICGIVYKAIFRHLFVWQLLFSVAALIVTHVTILHIIRKIRKSGGNSLNVIFVGGDHNNRELCEGMEQGFGVNGYKILGFFTSEFNGEVTENSNVPILGAVHEATSWLDNNSGVQVDELYCSLNPAIPEEHSIVDELVKYCEANFIKFYYVPNMDGYLKRKMEFTRKGFVTVISLHKEPLTNPFARLLKRVADILISFTFIVTVFWWVYIIIGIGVKLSSPGPILFKQKRTGYNGKAFTCLKFRSMRVSADADTKQATADDPRKTKFGDFIRRTSIDELPQFINVLKGDMSIIGPRPHMEHQTDMYSKLISDYMVRHLVRPGITGWAQISGCRGETKTLDEMKARVQCDIWYIENWSPALDILIFFKTIIQAFQGDEQAY